MKTKLKINEGRNFLLIFLIISANSIIEKIPIIISEYNNIGFKIIIKNNVNIKNKDVYNLFLKFFEII